MEPLTEDEKMLRAFYDVPLRTLEQGFNDIKQCVRSNRIRILFRYKGEIITGKVEEMTKFCLVIQDTEYDYNKMGNIYNYYTQQPITLDQLIEWYCEPDD